MTKTQELKKIFKKFMCGSFGHDPKLSSAYDKYSDGRYIATYVCDCGKKAEFDETVIKYPYGMIIGMFRRAK